MGPRFAGPLWRRFMPALAHHKTFRSTTRRCRFSAASPSPKRFGPALDEISRFGRQGYFRPVSRCPHRNRGARGRVGVVATRSPLLSHPNCNPRTQTISGVAVKSQVSNQDAGTFVMENDGRLIFSSAQTLLGTRVRETPFRFRFACCLGNRVSRRCVSKREFGNEGKWSTSGRLCFRPRFRCQVVVREVMITVRRTKTSVEGSGSVCRLRSKVRSLPVQPGRHTSSHKLRIASLRKWRGLGAEEKGRDARSGEFVDDLEETGQIRLE
jgi:hypothetical protein